MLLADAKKVMENAGIEVTETETMKGSCKVNALSIGSGTVRPTIYEQTVEDMTETQLLGFIEKTFENLPEIDLREKVNGMYLLEHCISCIRHETDDKDTVKWPVYGDLEEYIRVDLGEDVKTNNNMSIVVTQSLLDSTGISEDVARKHARKNLRKKAVIKSMSEVLMGFTGEEMDAADVPDCGLMYIGTVESKLHGASVMLLDDVLRDFCREHNLMSVYIIPSSLHEVILTRSDMDEATVNSMIRDVNRTQVSEWEILSDHVYRFDVT